MAFDAVHYKFDARHYKNSVLIPLAKDKARLEVLQQVIREVQGVGGISAAGRLNTAELFVVEPSMAVPELASHLKSLEMTYNKQRNLPSAQLLKKLLDLFGKYGAADPAFWMRLAAEHGRQVADRLDAFARAVSHEHPLKVMTPEQVSGWAAICGVSANDLAAALSTFDVHVWPDFELPKVTIPRAVRKVTEFPEFRNLVDLVTWPRPAIDVEVLDDVHLVENGFVLPEDFERAQATFRQTSRLDAGARFAAQAALGAMAELHYSEEIRQFVLASVVDLAWQALRVGLPPLLVVEELASRGIHPGNAARIVAKLASVQPIGPSAVGGHQLFELEEIRDQLVSLTGRVSQFIEDRRTSAVAIEAEVPGSARWDHLEVKQVLSRALGIGVVGSDGRERVRPLLRANDVLPAEFTWTVQTSVDGQSSVSVDLYEQGGERQSANLEDNDFLGQVTLHIRPLPKGAEVEISLSVSLDGVLRLGASDPSSGHVSSVEAQVSVLEEESAGPSAQGTIQPVPAGAPAKNLIVGVHLGAAQASVAWINDFGQAEVLLNFDSSPTTPSVVYFEGDNNAVVGAEAKRAQLSDPDNACSLIKRHMGTVYPQEFRSQEYTPESISALILKELVKTANSELGEEVSKVVITVPAYFGIREKEATKQAGQIAGLEVVGVVPEPVAYLLSLGVDDNPEAVLVYDLGGYSFDVTVLRASPHKVEILALDGNKTLGGADWDDALAQLIADKFVAQAGLGDDNPRLDAEFEIGLLSQAEDTKKSLTKRENVTVRCRYQDKDEQVAITRAEFEAATRHLVAQTLEISQRVVSVAEAKVPGLKVDRVLLVGGSSKMPMIDAAFREQLGWNPHPTDFDLAAAKGAAIYGAGRLNDGSSRGCQCCEEFFREGRTE